MIEERRCVACGALVSADAEWCGQCFTPLRQVGSEATALARQPAPVPSGGGAGPEVEGRRPTWTCPACDTSNPLEESACVACGTLFGRLFEEPSKQPELEPWTAAMWSMVLPGLGHWRLGRKGDALARFAVFGWTFGSLVILLVSRFGKGGLGPTLPLFLLFLAGSAAVYVLSAVDAYRVAGGDAPLVSSRALMWGLVALILVSILLASFITLPAARQ